MSTIRHKNWIAIAFVTLFAASTLLVAAPAAGSAEPRYLLVVDTPEGIVETIVTQSEVDATRTCALDAPTTVSCTNGPVTRSFAAGHGLLLPIPSGFTTPAGVVPVHKMMFTSFLRSASTERIFRCEVTETPAPAGTGAITFSCFPGSGAFPPVGASMTQTAIAFAVTTGGATDTNALSVYQSTGGQVLLPGLGRVTAQLTY